MCMISVGRPEELTRMFVLTEIRSYYSIVIHNSLDIKAIWGKKWLLVSNSEHLYGL